VSGRDESFEFESRFGKTYALSWESLAGDGLEGHYAAALVRSWVEDDRYRTSELARWGRRVSLLCSSDSDQATVKDLIGWLERGTFLVVREIPFTSRWSTKLRGPSPHRQVEREPLSERKQHPLAPEPIEDTQKSLLISRCDPVLGEWPLTFSYLVRGLEKLPVSWRIVSDSFPGRVVHERPLAPSETTDGSHDAEWDGIVTTAGAHQGTRLGPDYSPASVEIGHDSTYRDSAPFLISRPVSVVHVVETEDVLFATGREILMPDDGLEQTEAEDHRSGLHAVAAVLRYASFHPDASLGVFGHTDTVGTSGDNLTLSLGRATNVQHVLIGDADAWAAHCQDHYEVADFQRVLRWVALRKGWATDPGPIDGQFGDRTRTARDNFRERMNSDYSTSLKRGVKQNIEDWRAYFTLYDEAIAEFLGGDARELSRVRAGLKLTTPATIGCGEAFPADQPERNSLESAANRRVDLVFFEPDEIPELPGEPPGHPLYGTKDYRAKYIPIDPGQRYPVRLRLLDGTDNLPGEDWVIELRGESLATGKTSAAGLVETELPTNEPGLVLRLPRLGMFFGLDVAALDPVDTPNGAQARLTNLGYPCPLTGIVDEATIAALIAFQLDQNLEPSGVMDGVTSAALYTAHGT
jgi:peptidoglycan hydrolase-like protein with peptidoglycan-binding domain